MTDFLILGGGSAGCALAARLSEESRHSVTLVEAGHDLKKETMSDIVRARYPGRAMFSSDNIWTALEASISGVGKNASAPPRRYEQARILGGGSAINAMVANRGAPGDYDEWGDLGAEGWSWESALPYFRKLERDCDIADDFHGKTGPIPIRRLAKDRTSVFTKAVADTLVARGHTAHPDQNGKWTDGVFPACIAVSDDGERIPVSVAYLTPDVRRRPNLRILTSRHVQRLIFEGKRAIGAEIVPTADSGEVGPPEMLRAQQIVLAFGGIHSPAMLMRSGIGPADELGKLGIPVLAHSAGVGRNLMEHSGIATSTYLPPGSRMVDPGEHHDQFLLRYTSAIANAPAGDMHVAILGRTGWHAVGQRTGTLFLWVNKTYSRGTVTLKSPDPQAEPVVDFRLLSDWRDMERLKQGFRLCTEALMDKRLDRFRGPVFPTSFSERVRKVSAPGAWNAFQMRMLGTALDFSFGLRRALVESVITLGLTARDLLADDAKLTQFVGDMVVPVWHASGTCRMGAVSDPLAVTDAKGVVKGVEGLRICDASLFPSIPRANTNTPTLMMTERIADLIKAEG